MLINDLKIPSLLVELLASGSLRRSRGSWPLREEQDHSGNRLETELGYVFSIPDEMQKETSKLSNNFVADGCYGSTTNEFAGPGAIPDIMDFGQIVCFAQAGDGSPFCLDFRGDNENPSVIWWDDVYWRRIAPSFETFISLFEVNVG